MNKTKIPWCDYTWNPIVGCSRISEGCINCYAAAIAKRFNQPWGHPVFMPERLGQPAKEKKPGRIFVCSVSDIGHSEVRREWRDAVCAAMAAAPWHTFIILTKRPENLAGFDWRPHWVGVTAENQKNADRRVPVLVSIEAGKRFVSVEPMLEMVSLQKAGIDWVIAGPENGPKARPCKAEWIEMLSFDSPCFFDKRNNFARREFPTQNPMEQRTGHLVDGTLPPIVGRPNDLSETK